MFEFTDRFNTLENDELILKITQKYNGNDEMIPFYYYDIIRKADSVTVGKISIRIGNNFHSYYNGHIGYEIFKEYRGNDYAYKASLMVLDVARFHGMGFVYLTCDESNTASYKTIEKLGAELVEISDVPRKYFGWHDDMEMQRIYKLGLDSYSKGEKCVYCGSIISKSSREHIIQNALGGLYESEDICCDTCNKFISKHIDAPFTKTFNPIISQIDNFAKTNNTKSSPSYTGHAVYDGKIYAVTMKDGKVVSCPELSALLKKNNIKNLDWQIIACDFNIENKSFITGLSKIAFNYALVSGIALSELQHGVNIEKDGTEIKSISFAFPIIPFIALNPMDSYLELQSDFTLYHNLILFSQDNKLWCYIDLFNTFQYYVLLSDSWNGKCKISKTYLQLLQKLDRTKPDIHIRRQKHILILSDLYNIEPTTDIEELKRRINIAIDKESLKKSMIDVISQKFGSDYMKNFLRPNLSQEDKYIYGNSLLLYFDEDDKLKEDTFRRVTLCDYKYKVVSYPLLIQQLCNNNQIDVRKYTKSKFYRLNKFLVNPDSISDN